MHVTFILLFLFSIFPIMKKKDITHPKLYFDYKIINGGVKLLYYSNNLGSSGKRLVNLVILDSHSFSKENILELNKNEYKKLLIYISRQEKIMSNYFKKNLYEQYNIVKDSLSLMYDFKKEFDSFFIDFESNAKL